MSKVSGFSDESSEEDPFSASEDEWQPAKNDVESSEADSDAAEPSILDEPSENKKKSSKKPTTSRKTTKRVKVSSLRSKMFNKYKPPPKTITSPKPLNNQISKILEDSQFKGKKSISSSQDSQDSDSSGDDYLVKPHEIDLKSNFFDVKSTEKTDEPPNFDCNAGMQLTDSEIEDEDFIEPKKEPDVKNDDEELEDTDKKNSMISKINQESSSRVNFNQLHQYTKDLERAKEQLKNMKSDTFKDDSNIDVSKLLAMGEGSVKVASSPKTVPVKRKRAGQESDSDWEEVQGKVKRIVR